MTEIKWQAPPKHGNTRWSEVAEQLRSNPGQWALIKTGAVDTGLYMRIKNGIGCWAPGGFESRIVRKANETYARYVGEQVSA